MGNPLLDISAEVPESFMVKYGITPNNAILAEAAHLPMFEEMEKNFAVSYIAGGATQNSARVCKYMVGEKATVSYVGSVGADHFGKVLEHSAREEGVDVHYKKVADVPTGTCAVCVHGKERSLVANLGAAEKYTIDHLNSADVKAALDAATHVYIGGFFLTHSADTIMEVAKIANATGKVMCMNTSAPFLFDVPFFAGKFHELWAHLDYVFGNESEALALARSHGWTTTDISEIAKQAAALPKANAGRPRFVVITQGCDPTVVASSDGTVQLFPVNKIPRSAVVDTNGAGDSFAGGFLAALMMGKTHEVCCAAGAWCGGMIVQRSGCSLPKKVGTFTQTFF